MFANRKYEEPSYPKKTENVRPHSSNSVENETPLLACEQALLFGRVSSRENATPSSGTPPLASYKEVPPPPPLGLKTVTQQLQKESCHVRTSLKSWN